MQKLIHQLLLFQITEQNYSNLIFSPLSLEMLLGLILPGTQGNTRQELLQALEITEEEVNSYLAELQTTVQSLLKLQSDDEAAMNSTKLQLANSIWHRSDVPPNAHYERTVSTRFPIELFQFSDPIQATTQRINQWTSDQTNGLITQLPISLDQDAYLVLLNALYLKGFWSRPFYAQEANIFYTLDGSETSCEYMCLEQDQASGSGQAQYLKKEHFHALRLMFNDGRMGLEVYLPYENTGLTPFIDQLTPDDFNRWKNEFTEAPYFYFLMPRFEISDDLKLGQVADQLGIASLFKFSDDLTPLLHSREPLRFSEIGQSAKIKVTEEGLEAAAVSFGVAVGGGPPPQSNPMIVFEADHPFLYRLVDTITNKVLFQGVFTTPAPVPHAVVAHLNKRLYKEYEQKSKLLSDKERFVILLLMVEYGLDQHPLQHRVLPDLLAEMWQALATQSTFDQPQLIEDYRAYHEFQENYALNTEYDHLKKYKYWEFGETLTAHQLEILFALSTMFEMGANITQHNYENFLFGLTTMLRQDLLLPNYDYLEQLLKQKQQDGLFQRIAISELEFDEIPSKITYTEAEKQARAEAKEALAAYQKQQAEASKIDQLDEKIKIGLSAYIITQLRDQLGENYSLMDRLLNLLWAYLAKNNDESREKAAQMIVWMLASDGFEALPGGDYKDKFHLKAIRTQYGELMVAVRLLLSQLIAPDWDWEYQSIREFESLFQPETMPFPRLDIFSEIVAESWANQPNLVLDYHFFDQIATAIKSSQVDLKKYLT